MLLANLLVAQMLGLSEYGRYALLQTSISLLGLLAQLGFGVIIAQQVSKSRAHDPKLAGEIATFCFLITGGLAILFSAALLFGREILSVGLFRDQLLEGAIPLAALSLPWFALNTVQQGLFNGLERFRDQAKVSIAMSPLVIALPAGGAYRFGLAGALAGLALVYFCRVAASHVLLARALRSAGIPWSLGNLRAKFRLLGRFALPATLAGAVVSFAIWGGQTILVRSEHGTAMVGLFASAFLVKSMVTFLPTQMIGALLPVISRVGALGEAGHSRQLLYFNLALSLLVSGALAGGGILFASSIMSVFGKDFASGASVLVILLLAAPLEVATITLYQDILARERFWRTTLAVNLPLAVVALVGASVLIPFWGVRGLALAWLIGWAVALCGVILAMERGSQRAFAGDPGGHVERAPLP